MKRHRECYPFEAGWIRAANALRAGIRALLLPVRRGGEEEHCLFNRSWGGISNYRLVDYFIEDSRTIKKEDIVVFGLTDPQRLTFWCDGKDSKVGTPYLEKAKVTGKIVKHGKSDKLIVFKMKRRKDYRRTQGHRQNFTEVLIEAINS